MGALFLASKIEECVHPVRDVVNVFHYAICRYRGKPYSIMDYYCEEYMMLRNEVVIAERYILKELGFNIHVAHPHKLIISYLKLLQLVEHRQLVQRAWNYLNDGLRTVIFLIYPHHVIATSVIWLACRDLGVSLPEESDEEGDQPKDHVRREPGKFHAWYQIFDTSLDDIEDVARHILHLYQHPLPRDLPLTVSELNTPS
jgi:cyclin L